jgi:hypothetical protein
LRFVERAVPRASEAAVRSGALAQLTGGTGSHPHRPRRRGDHADAPQAFDERNLPLRRPPAGARRHGVGREEEEVVGLLRCGRLRLTGWNICGTLHRRWVVGKYFLAPVDDPLAAHDRLPLGLDRMRQRRLLLEL